MDIESQCQHQKGFILMVSLLITGMFAYLLLAETEAVFQEKQNNLVFCQFLARQDLIVC